MPNISLTAPYSTQQAELDRRRKLAMALQQESMTPLEMPQTPGVRISPYAGLAKILSGIAGNYKASKLDKEQRALDTSKQELIRQQMAQLLSSQGGTTQYAGPVQFPTQRDVSLPPDPYTNAAALSSEFPQVQQLAAALMGQNAKRSDTQQAQGFDAEQAALQRQFLGGQREKEMAQALQLANRPQFKEFGTATGGSRFGQVDPATAQFTQQGEIPGVTPRPPTPAAPRTVTTDKGIFILNPDGSLGNRLGNRPPTAGQVSANVPGDWNKTGEEFIGTIPAQWRQTVKKIAQYDEDPTKVASMRGGMREQLMQWVNQVNPEYDASQFSNRAPTRKAFTTGTQGQQINAINTAIGHIDMLTGLADKLQNGGFVPGNEAWNRLRTTFGANEVTNFDTLKDALAGEVASVLSKGGATVSGIAEAKDKVRAASSPKQLAGYVETLIPVMGSKLEALDYQYHQAMGPADTFSALSPESKAILAKRGFAQPNADPSSGLPAVGGTFNGAKVLKVTPVQ